MVAFQWNGNFSSQSSIHLHMNFYRFETTALGNITSHLNLWPSFTNVGLMCLNPPAKIDPALSRPLPLHIPESLATECRFLFDKNDKRIEISGTDLGAFYGQGLLIQLFRGNDRHSSWGRPAAELRIFQDKDGYALGSMTQHERTSIEWHLRFTRNDQWDWLSLSFRRGDGEAAHFAFSINGERHITARDENGMRTRAALSDRFGFESDSFFLETGRIKDFFEFPETYARIVIPKPKSSWESLDVRRQPIEALNLVAGALKLIICPDNPDRQSISSIGVDAILISAAQMNDFGLP